MNLGFIAFVMLLLLFITSNDLSIRLLGDWWTRIHWLSYLIMWVVLIHVMLQGRYAWTILIGITSVAEISSFIVARARRRTSMR